MNAATANLRRNAACAIIFAAGALGCGGASAADPAGTGLAPQVFEVMVQIPGVQPGLRVAHAKGIVCEGTFTPAKSAAALSKAAHFQAATVPVTIRFSGGAADPSIPDYSPDAAPRGMAIRFKLPAGGTTDIVAISHNGFIVGTGEDFLALQKAVLATNPSQPHPWPIESFIGAHPLALKFVQEAGVVPASFGTSAFFGNNAFIFVNKDGVRQPGRYQILPLAGQHDLGDAEAKTRTANFLGEELRTRLASGPVEFRLVVQLPNAGDPTADGSLVWPNDRKTVEMGTIRITSVVADSDAAQKTLVFFPTSLTDGIEQSDDPLPALRTAVYALSFARRQQR